MNVSFALFHLGQWVSAEAQPPGVWTALCSFPTMQWPQKVVLGPAALHSARRSSQSTRFIAKSYLCGVVVQCASPQTVALSAIENAHLQLDTTWTCMCVLMVDAMHFSELANYHPKHEVDGQNFLSVQVCVFFGLVYLCACRCKEVFLGAMLRPHYHRPGLQCLPPGSSLEG